MNHTVTRGALIVAAVISSQYGGSGGHAIPTRASNTPEVADIILRNGRIVDGTGGPSVNGDVALRGDRIVAIGMLPASLTAARVIDVKGAVMAPGFIDMLGQSERTIFHHPQAPSKVTQGITTELTGEVESPWLSRSGRGAGDRAPYSSLEDFFAHYSRLRGAINIGMFVTLGSVRGAVMGDDPGRPSAAQLAAMGRLVDSAMCHGAIGVSAALLYPPASYFRTPELVALARRSAAYGGGYATHLRSESDSLLTAVDEALRIGSESGAWVQLHHLKAAGREQWGAMSEVVARVDDARRQGVHVVADVYPYLASGASLSVVLPEWARRGSTSDLVRRLGAPKVRQRLGRDPALRRMDPSRVIINEVHIRTLRGLEGRSLKAIAERWRMPPVEALMRILAADSGRTGALIHSMDEADLRTALRAPWVGFGTDAGAQVAWPGSRAHPRAFGTFPRIFAQYTNGRPPLLSIEETIRRMTSLPARIARLESRGELRAGYYADVAVFQASALRDRSTYGGPPKLATGIDYLFVNGVGVIEGGRMTGEHPGRPLRARSGCGT